MDKNYLLTKSKAFCLAPWMSIHTWPDGNVYPCCLWDSSSPVGSLKNNTMDEIWNSEKIKEGRVNMMNDIKHKSCTRCYELEEITGQSYRKGINSNHKNAIHYLDETEEDGTLNNQKFVLWDIRISNFCNFKCRSCGTELSSSWYSDAVKLGKKMHNNKPVITIADKVDFMGILEPHFEYVNEIYFAGGEPLIMPEHYEILDKLIEKNKTNTVIRYSTNFSILSYRNKHIFDYWKNFKNLDLFVSVDGINNIGEYVRKGFKDEIFIKNVNDFFDSGVKYKTFGYGITYGTLNYLHLFDMILFFFENNLINKFYRPERHIHYEFSPINQPDHYDCSFLPDEYKQQFKARLDTFKDELIEINVANNVINEVIKKLTDVYTYSLKNTFNQQILHKFFHMTESLDGLRNEKFEEIFPYYKNLKSYL